MRGTLPKASKAKHWHSQAKIARHFRVRPCTPCFRGFPWVCNSVIWILGAGFVSSLVEPGPVELRGKARQGKAGQGREGPEARRKRGAGRGEEERRVMLGQQVAVTYSVR